MSIKYKTVRVYNPKGADGVEYYRPRVVKTDDYTTEALEKDINDSTGVSDVDVHSVLFALNKQLRKALLDGRTIVLDGIGRISVGMDTTSFTEEERNAAGFVPSRYVKGVHLNFLPCASIKKELNERNSLHYISEKR